MALAIKEKKTICSCCPATYTSCCCSLLILLLDTVHIRFELDKHFPSTFIAAHAMPAAARGVAQLYPSPICFTPFPLSLSRSLFLLLLCTSAEVDAFLFSTLLRVYK